MTSDEIMLSIKFIKFIETHATRSYRFCLGSGKKSLKSTDVINGHSPLISLYKLHISQFISEAINLTFFCLEKYFIFVLRMSGMFISVPARFEKGF